MGHLDDLPQRPSAHDTAQIAESSFENSINSLRLFQIQSKDRHDYGTDFQIEARDGPAVTNFRVHVQLKGTDIPANQDASVSVQIARSNLNYLLAQPHSLYICHHIPSGRLLVRHPHDVYREYEADGQQWRVQDQITVRFKELFDAQFQQRLHATLLAVGRSERDRRLTWTATPPDQVPAMIQNLVPLVEVPEDPTRAQQLLVRLYSAGQDAAISKSFTRFAAVLGNQPGAMDFAYLSEINLGINGSRFDTDRVRRGIALIQDAITGRRIEPGSGFYSEGNGWLALGEYEKATEVYQKALEFLEKGRFREGAAQCCKNMGSAIELLGRHEEAAALYRRAINLDPDLGEAHFAIALWHMRHGTDVRAALAHLDAVIPRERSSIQMAPVQGWRIELLFKMGDCAAAFREIHSLTAVAGTTDWVWPSCARQVAQYGRTSADSARRALVFWRAYIRVFSDHMPAERERLLCLWYLHSEGEPTEMNFHQFKSAALRLVARDPSSAAFLWDRIGHWAQTDGKWNDAEAAFREAYLRDPDRYGYCLGTALNFLKRYEESLPILMGQAKEEKRDAMSWFQVAIAREGLGDFAGAVEAYTQAIDLNPDYALAWFNLGGIHWNTGDVDRASIAWRQALRRFPKHPEAERLRTALPFVTGLEEDDFDWGQL